MFVSIFCKSILLAPTFFQLALFNIYREIVRILNDGAKQENFCVCVIYAYIFYPLGDWEKSVMMETL